MTQYFKGFFERMFWFKLLKFACVCASVVDVDRPKRDVDRPKLEEAQNTSDTIFVPCVQSYVYPTRINSNSHPDSHPDFRRNSLYGDHSITRRTPRIEKDHVNPDTYVHQSEPFNVIESRVSMLFNRSSTSFENRLETSSRVKKIRWGNNATNYPRNKTHDQGFGSFIGRNNQLASRESNVCDGHNSQIASRESNICD